MMKESDDLSVLSIASEVDSKSTRTGWLEKHAELIKKLEAEYQFTPDANKSSTDERYFGFTIGSLNMLLSASLSSEILEDSLIYPIPLSPNWLLGACNHRGDIVPVIDFEQIISGDKSAIEAGKHKTLVLDKDENAIGIQLSKLPSPINFKKKERLNNFSKLPKLVQPFVTKAYKKGGKIWVCVDFPFFIESFTN